MSVDKSFQAVVAAMGSFLVVTVVLGVALVMCRKRKSSRGRRGQSRSLSASAIAEESRSFEASLSRTDISMDKIRSATRNFSPELIVGDGSFGLVYRAELAGGRTVAVKRLDPDAFQGLREFRAEIDTLGILRHPNLARILGFCASGPDRILIYEFVERGNLDYWLHDPDHDQDSRLTWPTRVKVVRGVARGLDYLHGLPKQIIHRDIKASNVLLDADFEPRISDFGLARYVETSRSHVSTQSAGTMGYMPPEYKDGYTIATVHADVYSFGVLMLEIAVARRPNLPVLFDGCEMGLVHWARRMADASRHLDMLDPLMPQAHSPAQHHAAHYFRVACLCTHEVKRDRPPMKDVLRLLSDDAALLPPL